MVVPGLRSRILADGDTRDMARILTTAHLYHTVHLWDFTDNRAVDTCFKVLSMTRDEIALLCVFCYICLGGVAQ